MIIKMQKNYDKFIIILCHVEEDVVPPSPLWCAHENWLTRPSCSIAMGGGLPRCSEALRRWHQCFVLGYQPFPQCNRTTWRWRTHPLAVSNWDQSLHNHNAHRDRRRTKQEKIMLLCSLSNLTHRSPFSQARRYFMYEFYWLFSDYSQSDSIRYLAVNHNYRWKVFAGDGSGRVPVGRETHCIRVAETQKQFVIWKLPPSSNRRFVV